jgi:hypothetical protein
MALSECAQTVTYFICQYKHCTRAPERGHSKASWAKVPHFLKHCCFWARRGHRGISLEASGKKITFVLQITSDCIAKFLRKKGKIFSRLYFISWILFVLSMIQIKMNGLELFSCFTNILVLFSIKTVVKFSRGDLFRIMLFVFAAENMFVELSLSPTKVNIASSFTAGWTFE